MRAGGEARGWLGPPWVLLTLAMAVSFGSAVVTTVVSGIAFRLFRAGFLTSTSVVPVAEVVAPLVSLVLYIWISRAIGRVVGDGDVRAGLGFGPVYWGFVLIVGVGLTFVAMMFHVAIADVVPKTRASLFDLFELHVVKLVGTHVQVIARETGTWIVAPIAEELVFRGWLWTGLRRCWPPWAANVATAVAFAASHSLDGSGLALVVVPMTIVLTFVRQHGGGVQGTMLLHLLANVLGDGYWFLARLAEPEQFLFQYFWR